MSEAEIIIALPEAVTPATHVRSTLIQSSLRQLKASGHFEAYERRLPEDKRAEILDTLAPTWLSMDVAIAHYQACDELRLTAAELTRIGEAVGKLINNVLIGALARAAKLTGVTPWQFYGQVGRVWRRTFQGGAVGLTRVAPTESLIDIRGLALCRFEYFRYGCCGVFTSIANLAANRVTTTIVDHSAEALRLRGTWKA
jgi:hypothetical protein